ncbi:cytochrome P450 [Dactylonectria macrodidyma]|uniref:Cytochrome P450 n=1 Tax=Dactylonectria macrodidyma TaxID=307937 RepID=A0A9P9DY15_9HYPO|nr:cytochrome P450 [Dactylonectria macrodidyma]
MAGIAQVALSPGPLIYTALLLLLVGNVVSFILTTRRPKAFPPGPPGVPGLGNLLQIDKSFPFRTYGAWAKDHGNDTPLGIKKAANNVVVLNSGRLVRELFEKRGAVYSDRPWQYINNDWILGNDLRITLFEKYSPWLARWRREFSHIFNVAAITRFRPVYEAETARLLVKLLESPTARRRDLEDILVCWIVSVPCLGLCGRRPDDLGDHDFNVKQFRHDQEQYLALLTPGAGDVFPLLRYLPELFGMAQWKDKARYVRQQLFKAELQQRARNEVLGVLGGAPPKATDLTKLKYLEAFYNEIHRWRPVAPQGAAHSPSQDDVFDGYRIPKGASVIANVWHIHHSTDDYDDPEEFIPERFLRHPYGMRLDEAHDPARLEGSGPRLTYAFGAGRRICPGMDSARQSLLLGLAKVLWAFDILPPEGKDIDLNMETGFISDLALRPKKFDVALKLRDGRSKDDIMSHYYQAYESQAEVMGWEGGLYR